MLSERIAALRFLIGFPTATHISRKCGFLDVTRSIFQQLFYEYQTMISSISNIIKSMLNDRSKPLTVKERIVIVVNALRAEGYQDEVIRNAVRMSFAEGVVTRQFVNRVLVAKIAEGGCGMAKERRHTPSNEQPKKIIKVDPDDVDGLFSALLTHFDGKPLKVIVLADMLNDLALKMWNETKNTREFN
jgi:hypothetical protein